MSSLYEKIEDYLLNELPEPERLAFEQALLQDKALAEATEKHRDVLQRLEGARLRHVVQTALKTASEPSSSRSWWWLFLLMLGGIGAMVFMFFPKPTQTETPTIPIEQTPTTPIAQQPSSPDPAISPVKPPTPNVQQWTALARKYQAKPMASTLRTDTPAGSTEKSALVLAQEAYQQGKYREVLQVLQNAPVDEDVQYMQANALFQLNRFAAAEPLFQMLLSSFQYKHEARWNRFLCQMAGAALQGDQVRKQASIMAGDEGFELRDKARQLLKELDAMGAVNK